MTAALQSDWFALAICGVALAEVAVIACGAVWCKVVLLWEGF